MDKRQPLIGITGPASGALGPRLCIAAGVRLAGATPVQLSPVSAAPARELDGLIISGGHDVEPVLYKAAREVEGMYDADRDEFESQMIDQALRGGVPLLGICRGAQLINVCRGGSLFQNLRLRYPDQPRRRSVLPINTIDIEESTVLHKTVARKRIRVNRLHNQSIDRTGVGLKVGATDDRNIVQAIESTDEQFVLGVQWHPEFLLYKKPDRQIFRALVAAAARRPGEAETRS